jgi:tRNA dimethylallyltransferase
MNSKTKQPVLIIVGPTAVGKTDLSIRLAGLINGEIISADSRLLYNGMNIGTAKPTKAQLEKVKHHLVDISEPQDTWSLAKYNEHVKKAIEDIQYKGRLPILVGGTGQYVRSLLEGWDIPEVAPDEEMRKVLETWGSEIGARELHKRLKIIDPRAAEMNDPENLRRTVRALEVIFRTGCRFSDQRLKDIPPHNFKVIGLIRPRVELFKRVDNRIESMFASGFVQEVEELLSMGIPLETHALSAIGYSEVIRYFQGEISLEEAKVLMRKKTRNFIRKQTNWFKPDDPAIEWFEMEPDPIEEIHSSIYNWLRKALTGD